MIISTVLLRIFSTKDINHNTMNSTKTDTLKYLLIPVNFDEKGAGVVTYGVTLARELNLKIKLLHVLTMAGIPAPVEAHAGSTAYSYSPGELMNERKKQAEEKLRAMSNQVKKQSGVDCRFSAKFGFVDIQVLEESEKDQVAMVVMGTPGHDTILNQLLGSRSLKIVNHGEVPVLLIPDLTGYLPIRQIVTGVNYENWNESKNQWLVQLAEKLQAKLHFVRVADKKTSRQKLMFNGYKEKVSDTLPENVRGAFKLIINESIDHGLRDYAHSNHADMIALQRSRKSGWDQFFSDNLPKDMVAGTSLPILVY